MIKRFSYNTKLSGHNITLLCYAKSMKEAIALFDVDASAKKYISSGKSSEKEFEGVYAYFDSGELWRNYRDLIRVQMPLDEMKKLIAEFNASKQAHVEAFNKLRITKL